MSANFGENTRTQEIRHELQGDLSMLEGLTKADLFIENNSLQKALKFMETQLEEKLSNSLLLTGRPDPNHGRR